MKSAFLITGTMRFAGWKSRCHSYIDLFLFDDAISIHTDINEWEILDSSYDGFYKDGK